MSIYEIICPGCDCELELENDEIIRQEYVCPECGTAADILETSRNISSINNDSIVKYPNLNLLPRQVLTWRRLLARNFDIFIICIPIIYLFSHLMPFEIFWSHFSIFSYALYTSIILIATQLIWVAIEGVLLSTVFTTPGKWLLGLKVQAINGERLKIKNAFKRTFLAELCGTFFSIPPISSIFRLFWYFRVKRNSLTLWDRKCKSRVRCDKQKSSTLFVLLVFITWGYFFNIGTNSGKENLLRILNFSGRTCATLMFNDAMSQMTFPVKFDEVTTLNGIRLENDTIVKEVQVSFPIENINKDQFIKTIHDSNIRDVQSGQMAVLTKRGMKIKLEYKDCNGNLFYSEIFGHDSK